MSVPTLLLHRTDAVPLPHLLTARRLPAPPLEGGAKSAREVLWQRVMLSQFAPRVGAKREKALTITATMSTFAASGAVAALGAVAVTGVGLVALPLLATTNGILGLVSLDAAIGTFRHTRPPRPGALRRHSFYLTGIVSSRHEARAIVEWLTARNIVGEGRQRPVLALPTPRELVELGLTEQFKQLDATQVEKIAETLNFVRACADFFASRPSIPDVHSASRAPVLPWRPAVPSAPATALPPLPALPIPDAVV